MGRGDRVAIGMRNYPEWVVSFAAITSIGAISVSLNAWWTEDELSWALEDCGAKVLVADRERVERTATPPPSWAAPSSACAWATAPGRRRPLGGRAAAGRPLPEVAVDPEDDATILYTSAPPAAPRARCRPTGRWSTACWGSRRAWSTACAARPPSRPRGAAPRPARVHPHRAAVPRHGLGAGDAVVLASGLKLVIMYRWDPTGRST